MFAHCKYSAGCCTTDLVAVSFTFENRQQKRLFLLLKAKEVCQTGLRVNSSSISMLGDPAKGKISI